MIHFDNFVLANFSEVLGYVINDNTPHRIQFGQNNCQHDLTSSMSTASNLVTYLDDVNLLGSSQR
jgi:hypothetical protein